MLLYFIIINLVVSNADAVIICWLHARFCRHSNLGLLVSQIRVTEIIHDG